jgi:SpoVK/Ycf46/Vps4 family AAA+-type ATPase
MGDIDKDFMSLARLASEGKINDSMVLVCRISRELIKRRPDLADEAKKLLQKNMRTSYERSHPIMNDPIPVDLDSRLELLKKEIIVTLESEPVWNEGVRHALEGAIAERKHQAELLRVGLNPTRSMLFVGSPGVGKTLSARWLAMKLERPLFVLDLAAVMSSYLGKTGNNIRSVLDFAQKRPSVLLLDEFDAIAKRRDDSCEVGELKRLVTVLLQAIDDWPSDGLLLAATNHPKLLDPAVWRRFDRIIEFPNPSPDEQEKYIGNLLCGIKEPVNMYLPLLSAIFEGLTFAEIQKKINIILRESVVEKKSFNKCLHHFLSITIKVLDVEKKLQVARILERQGHSQRDIHEFTGCSRDTLRDHGIAIKSMRSTSTERAGL